MMESGFGKFIERHRIASGYKSQRKLADATGISSATISRIESEEQRPQPETLQILSKYLKTTSYVELMFVCGYWDKDELLTPINDAVIKETPSQYDDTEKEFIKKINLSDDEILGQFRLMIDGRELSDQEAKSVIAFVRTLRQQQQG